MKLENFVKDQKDQIVELQVKMDEQEAIIKTANKAQKEAFDSMFSKLEERVKDWDKADVVEYLRITNQDDDVSGIEQEMVLIAFCNTHKDSDGKHVMQALKARVALEEVDLLADLMFR